jgi:hypothetical protein
LTICNVLGYNPDVPYRRILNPQPSPEADIDTPEMAVASAYIDDAEEDLRALSRLREIAMEMAEAQLVYAKARLARAESGEAPLRDREDPAGCLDRITLTVRRIAALKARLRADLQKRRAGLVGERAARRERRAQDHQEAVNNEIDTALTEAFTVMYGDADDETDEGDALCNDMLADKENLLGDLRDYLTRPVGETIAKLCVALGLPADACVKQDGVWLIARDPSPYEKYRQTRATDLKHGGKLAVISPSLPRSGEGQTAKPSGWGTLDEAPHCYRVGDTSPPWMRSLSSRDPGASCPSP